MTKNVIVVDEFGNNYAPTYAKRAKGLVKNGRARWVDESTICLACPPDASNLEDSNMETKVNPAEINSAAQELSLDVILSRMDRIIEQGDQLAQAAQQIQALPINEGEVGGYDGQARAEAIGSIYTAREATNQKILSLLTQMYDDLVGRVAPHE